jgi:hypothetical protein
MALARDCLLRRVPKALVPGAPQCVSFVPQAPQGRSPVSPGEHLLFTWRSAASRCGRRSSKRSSHHSH